MERGQLPNSFSRQLGAGRRREPFFECRRFSGAFLPWSPRVDGVAPDPPAATRPPAVATLPFTGTSPDRATFHCDIDVPAVGCPAARPSRAASSARVGSPNALLACRSSETASGEAFAPRPCPRRRRAGALRDRLRARETAREGQLDHLIRCWHRVPVARRSLWPGLAQRPQPSSPQFAATVPQGVLWSGPRHHPSRGPSGTGFGAV
jgi:hypothetical protein